MFLLVQKGVSGGICHTIYPYVKANNKHMKDYDKNKKSLYLKYWDVNNSCVWEISQTLPENNFKWVEDVNLLKIL